MKAIARCNSTLKALKITSDLTESETVSYEAQAKALRGFFHFEAKRMWNMVPFIDENENPYEADNNSDIWPEIESDLRFAFDNLARLQVWKSDESINGRLEHFWRKYIYIRKNLRKQNHC